MTQPLTIRLYDFVCPTLHSSGMDYQGGDMGGGFGGSGGGGGGSSYGGGGGGNKGFGGGGGGNSQGQQRARKSYDDQTLIPVTARMVLASQPSSNTEGNLQLQDGRELHMVKLIGAIRSYEDFSTNVLYSIEDGTGLIDVKQWLDENECSVATEIRQATLKDHIYVRVIGQVKDYDGNKQIIASSVRALTSSNELTHHMLEVVYSGERAKVRDAIVSPHMMMSTSTMTTPMGAGFGPPLGMGQPLAPVGYGGGGVPNELKEAVVKYIRAESSKLGMALAIDLPFVMRADVTRPSLLIFFIFCFEHINQLKQRSRRTRSQCQPMHSYTKQLSSQ